MKIFAISDLHLSISEEKPMDIFGGVWDNYLEDIKKDWCNKVSEDDVVIIAGDLSWAMRMPEFLSDMQFFNSLPGKKVIIRGNHDYWWSSYSKVKQSLPENFYALQNNAIKIGNYVFCGTRGWNLPDEDFSDEDTKIYNREQIRLELALSSAKDLLEDNDKLILIMHYPPYNFKNLDNEFMKLIYKNNPNAVVFGHIHQSKGKYRLQEKINGINFYLTSCDLLENKLMRIF